MMPCLLTGPLTLPVLESASIQLGLRLGLGNSVEQLTSCRPPKEASARARRRGYPAMQRLPDLSGSGSIPLTSAPDEAPWPWSAADLSVALGNVVQQHSFTHPVVVSSRCSVLTWKIKGGGGGGWWCSVVCFRRSSMLWAAFLLDPPKFCCREGPNCAFLFSRSGPSFPFVLSCADDCSCLCCPASIVDQPLTWKEP